MTTSQIVTGAIRESISRNVTVDLAWTPAIAAELASRCEGSTEDDSLPGADYWGWWHGAGAWRVHLERPATRYACTMQMGA